MKKAAKILSFALVLTATLAVGDRLLDSAAEACFRTQSDDFANLATELRRFERRDRSMPAVVFIGGSDVREGIDFERARSGFGAMGLQFFSTGHSSENALIEQYQILDALALSPNVKVYFNVEPLDLNVMDPPRYSDLFESVASLQRRKEIFGKSARLDEIVETWAKGTFSAYRNRFALKQCAQATSFETVKHKRYRYSDEESPDASARPEKKLPNYATVKLDAGKEIRKDNPMLGLLREIRRKYGDQVVFYELPRNPLYEKIVSKQYLEAHREAVKEFGVRKLGAHAVTDPKLFYDFNHMNYLGRRAFTEFLLTELSTAPRGTL